METRKLAAADRPRALYIYDVEGVGSFPLDMLRYDAAWPHNSESVSQMSTSRGHAEGRRVVGLVSHHRPTVERWKSFGWLVVE